MLASFLLLVACSSRERFYQDYAAATCEHDAGCGPDLGTSPKDQAECRESALPGVRDRWDDPCCVFVPDNAAACIDAWADFRCGVGQPDACDAVFACDACMSVDVG